MFIFNNTRDNIYNNLGVSIGKYPLSEINTGDSYYMKCNRFTGDKDIIFHTQLVKLLDRVFVDDCYDYLSKEQMEFIKRYVEEAAIVDSNIEENNDNPVCDMSDDTLQLDMFLGSYIGENNGNRFTSFTK